MVCFQKYSFCHFCCCPVSIFERGLNFAILMRRMQLMQFDLLFFFPPTNQDLIFWKNQGYFLDFVQLQVCKNVFSCTTICSDSPPGWIHQDLPVGSHPPPWEDLFCDCKFVAALVAPIHQDLPVGSHPPPRSLFTYLSSLRENQPHSPMHFHKNGFS